MSDFIVAFETCWDVTKKSLPQLLRRWALTFAGADCQHQDHINQFLLGHFFSSLYPFVLLHSRSNVFSFWIVESSCDQSLTTRLTNVNVDALPTMFIYIYIHTLSYVVSIIDSMYIYTCIMSYILHYTLHITYCMLHTTHYILHITHHILHITYHIFHNAYGIWSMIYSIWLFCIISLML